MTPSNSFSDYRARLGRPLLALLLGILPFFLFVGSTSQTTVNGQLVQDNSFNVLGLVLGVIGLLQAVRMLREDGKHPPRWLPRTLVLGLAVLACAFQLGYSAGLYSMRDFGL